MVVGDGFRVFLGLLPGFGGVFRGGVYCLVVLVGGVCEKFFRQMFGLGLRYQYEEAL